MALSLSDVTSPVLNWESLVQGHWYRGVPERGVQFCIPALPDPPWPGFPCWEPFLCWDDAAVTSL